MSIEIPVIGYNEDLVSDVSFAYPVFWIGNDLETLIGPGDSLLVGNSLVGGIALDSEWDWIHETTGLVVPEPSSAMLLILGSGGLVFYRRAKQRRKACRSPFHRAFK